MDILHAVFWLTGAAVWSVFGATVLLLLYGEWRYTRAATHFKRTHMTPEEFAMVQKKKPTVDPHEQ